MEPENICASLIPCRELDASWDASREDWPATDDAEDELANESDMATSPRDARSIDSRERICS